MNVHGHAAGGRRFFTLEEIGRCIFCRWESVSMKIGLLKQGSAGRDRQLDVIETWVYACTQTTIPSQNFVEPQALV